MNLRILFFLLFLSSLLCCQHYQATRTETPAAGNKFAQGFEISQNSNGFTINLLSPWMDNYSTTYQYNLVFSDSHNQERKVNSQTIKIPLKRVAIMSTTHLAMIESLGEMETVLGISERQYIINPLFWEHHKRKNVVEIGYENTLDVENVIKLNPDAVFVYGLSSGISQTMQRLLKIGIPVVFVSEFNEVHPLAKLEWLRFMACFFNKLDMADSIFDQKVLHYNQIKEMVVNVATRPTVLVGLPWKEVWNVPGNYTVTAAFIHDAGGKYLFSHLNQKVNYPLGIEEVFLQAGQADYWINVGFANSLDDIAATDVRFANFKAFSMGNVYNNNKIQNNVGGNDYLESGIMNPEVILKDLISVFHPEIFQEYVEIYYKKMH